MPPHRSGISKSVGLSKPRYPPRWPWLNCREILGSSISTTLSASHLSPAPHISCSVHCQFVCVVSRACIWKHGSYQRLHGRRFSFLATGLAGTSLGHVRLCKERFDPLGLLRGCFASRWVKISTADNCLSTALLIFFRAPTKKPAQRRAISIGRCGLVRRV